MLVKLNVVPVLLLITVEIALFNTSSELLLFPLVTLLDELFSADILAFCFFFFIVALFTNFLSEITFPFNLKVLTLLLLSKGGVTTGFKVFLLLKCIVLL